MTFRPGCQALPWMPRGGYKPLPRVRKAPSYYPSADREPKGTGWCCQRFKQHPDFENGLEKYTISWPGKNLQTKTTDPQLSPKWSQNDTEGPRAVNHTGKGTSSGRVTSNGSLHRPISKPGAQGYDPSYVKRRQAARFSTKIQACPHS